MGNVGFLKIGTAMQSHGEERGLILSLGMYGQPSPLHKYPLGKKFNTVSGTGL
jgi:hypothetical protein